MNVQPFASLLTADMLKYTEIVSEHKSYIQVREHNTKYNFCVAYLLSIKRQKAAGSLITLWIELNKNI